jgi:hypothetical protein
MHLAALDGRMSEVILLVDVKRIHVGAQGDGMPIRRRAAQSADHACARNAAMNFQPEFSQLSTNELGRAMLLKRRFRMRVDIPAP